MLRPYNVLIHHKPRPSQRGSYLIRPIRERHSDAGHVHDIRKRARPCNAGAHEQRSGAVGGKREYDPVRFGRRASDDLMLDDICQAIEASVTEILTAERGKEAE